MQEAVVQPTYLILFSGDGSRHGKSSHVPHSSQRGHRIVRKVTASKINIKNIVSLLKISISDQKLLPTQNRSNTHPCDASNIFLAKLLV